MNFFFNKMERQIVAVDILDGGSAVDCCLSRQRLGPDERMSLGGAAPDSMDKVENQRIEMGTLREHEWL